MKFSLGLTFFLILIIGCTENRVSHNTNVATTTHSDSTKQHKIGLKGIDNDKQEAFVKWVKYDSERYCTCLEGFTRFMQDHFWYEQKYDIDSDKNAQAAKNSMTILDNNSYCIIETSEKEPDRRAFLISLSDDNIEKYDFEFSNEFRRYCGQTAEMFLGIKSNMEPSAMYVIDSLDNKEKKATPAQLHVQ